MPPIDNHRPINGEKFISSRFSRSGVPRSENSIFLTQTLRRAMRRFSTSHFTRSAAAPQEIGNAWENYTSHGAGNSMHQPDFL
jgi:hypothetical protein